MSRHQDFRKLKGYVVLRQRGDGEMTVITPEDTSFFQTEKGAQSCADAYRGTVHRAHMVIEEAPI